MILFFLIFSGPVRAKPDDLEPIKSFTLINGCRLFSLQGTPLRTFPGQICIFLEDGSFISAHENMIRRISKDNEILWEMAGHFHHQVNLTPDKQRILALSSDVFKHKNENKRQDKFLILSLDGKILHEQLAASLFKDASIPLKELPMFSTMAKQLNAPNEISHFNSFYEIPALYKKSPASYIKEGNVIVNSIEWGFFILSPDLNKVLHHASFKNSQDHHVHDLQVNQNGNLIYFNNTVNGNPESKIAYYRHSEINEVHPVTYKMINVFSGSPKQLFHSPICANIQELTSELWLFTHFLTGTYIYSKLSKKIIANITETHYDGEKYIPSQQVTAEDLTKFLSHRNKR
jgi:hypothetical protein